MAQHTPTLPPPRRQAFATARRSKARSLGCSRGKCRRRSPPPSPAGSLTPWPAAPSSASRCAPPRRRTQSSDHALNNALQHAHTTGSNHKTHLRLRRHLLCHGPTPPSFASRCAALKRVHLHPSSTREHTLTPKQARAHTPDPATHQMTQTGPSRRAAETRPSGVVHCAPPAARNDTL